MLFGIMARLEGFEPPTYRFEVSIHTLTLKKINKLQPKIPNKLGKFRKPRANALLRKAPGLTIATRTEATNDSQPPNRRR